MKMQELLIFVLVLAGGAYIFLGTANSNTATDVVCEINQTEGGGTVNYSGPDGCTLELDVFATTGAKDVAEVCAGTGENACAEPYSDTGVDGCEDKNENGKGGCLEEGDDLVYNEANNSDPNGDNFNEKDNLTGTEGNKEYDLDEPYTDTNKDKQWTQSLYTFNWFEEVVVKGTTKRTYLEGNKNEPWKLSYESSAVGRVTIGIEVIDNYATSMNGETSSDTKKWSYKFNRKPVAAPKIALSNDGVVGIKAN